MRTVLIAHRDIDFAEQLADDLHQGGYRVILCPGPLPPQARCIRCDKGYCPLTEGADLMIYDPRLMAFDGAGRAHNLAVDSALAHPDVPMLLAWSPETAPDTEELRALRSQVPWIHVAAHDQATLLRQIHDLILAAATVPG